MLGGEIHPHLVLGMERSAVERADDANLNRNEFDGERLALSAVWLLVAGPHPRINWMPAATTAAAFA
jgi:hypothetical protein